MARQDFQRLLSEGVVLGNILMGSQKGMYGELGLSCWNGSGVFIGCLILAWLNLPVVSSLVFGMSLKSLICVLNYREVKFRPIHTHGLTMA